ncbi:MAG: polyprenyl synthetase family protein [Actinomycetaceae bacterium]|nr:polyprenyl synthetase family protein [Actinomycetaceae bacterium]
MNSASLGAIRADVSEQVRRELDGASWIANLPGDGEPFAEMLAPALSLMESGKRTRAALLAAAYLATGAADLTPATTAGAALELYQASALVHDDLIDHSPTRRGRPAAHLALAVAHQSQRRPGDPHEFGSAGAILLGDLLLSLSMEVCARACEQASLTLGHPTGDALLEFTRMTSEVAFGQFLDVRAEHMPPRSDAITGALSVITHKSARYSVVCPLAIGSHLGGGSPELRSALEAIGKPLGEAFQLRDDDLGIFGDAGVTGKPQCGDIAEGKRTVLLALTLESASDRDASWLVSRLGGELGPDDPGRIQDIVEASGARRRHEQFIAERENSALAAWHDLSSSHLAAQPGLDLLAELLAELSARQH